MDNVFEYTIDGLDAAAMWVLEGLKNQKALAFYGDMGAGKTTLIKEVCSKLGVTDIVNSPTFAIVNEYKTSEGLDVFHFDFYRIKSIEEVYDFGYEEYFYGDAYCFIEWPERIESILPSTVLKLSISETGKGSRKLEWK